MEETPSVKEIKCQKCDNYLLLYLIRKKEKYVWRCNTRPFKLFKASATLKKEALF